LLIVRVKRSRSERKEVHPSEQKTLSEKRSPERKQKHRSCLLCVICKDIPQLISNQWNK